MSDSKWVIQNEFTIQKCDIFISSICLFIQKQKFQNGKI